MSLEESNRQKSASSGTRLRKSRYRPATSSFGKIIEYPRFAALRAAVSFVHTATSSRRSKVLSTLKDTSLEFLPRPLEVADGQTADGERASKRTFLAAIMRQYRSTRNHPIRPQIHVHARVLIDQSLSLSLSCSHLLEREGIFNRIINLRDSHRPMSRKPQNTVKFSFLEHLSRVSRVREKRENENDERVTRRRGRSRSAHARARINRDTKSSVNIRFVTHLATIPLEVPDGQIESSPSIRDRPWFVTNSRPQSG